MKSPMSLLSFLIPLLFLFITTTVGFPEFVARFPNGDAGNRPGSGITCQHLGHENCVEGAPRNPFGQDWDDNGRKWDKALCEKDSDGDGLTNGEELGDPCCLWSLDNPTPLRGDKLSHPGDKSQDGAKDAPGCPSSQSPIPSSSEVVSGPNAQTSPSEVPAQSTAASPSGPAASTPSATPSPTEDDAVCFPAHATVQLPNGLIKRMDQLEIGDRVHIGGGQYSDVFLFTHKIPGVSHEFITIRAGTEDKLEASITLTKGHYIYANGKSIAADQVKVGDMLELHDGRMSPVMQIECTTFKGLYNPHTIAADMVVDGVKVSTYTTAVQSKIAHSLLAPLRAIYRWFGWSSPSFEKGAPRIVNVLP